MSLGIDTVFDAGLSGVLAAGRLFRTRALLWAALLFAIVLGLFFASVLGAHWMGLHGNWRYLPPIAFPIFACCVYVVLVRQFERRPTWELRVDSRAMAEVPVGFLFGGAYITAMWLLLWCFKLYLVHRGVWSRWFDAFVFNSYISGVLEELAFRAVLLRIFARLWGVRNGILLSSLLFGLAHFEHNSWLAIVGITLNAGITMGLLYGITGRIWVPIGAHIGYDFVETSVLGIGNHHGVFVSEATQGAPAWLTGGSFGPDAAVPAMVLGVLINLVLWRVAFGGEKATVLSSRRIDG